MKKRKYKVLSTLIYYPHFCYDCNLNFISDKQNINCRWCGSDNVVNYKKEIFRNYKNGI